MLTLASNSLRLPNRDARVLTDYTLLGRRVDVVETSRGCTFDCSFCSIIEMRGRNFHPYPIERVLADIADARTHGAQAIFLVDDNITLDVKRFEQLCKAIVDAGFEDSDYVVQAMTAPLAEHGARLAPLMKAAGFRYVFLGIENILDDDLQFLRARAKNAHRDKGRAIGNASLAAIRHLHANGMFVVGGLIVGNPDDTRESIEKNLEFAKHYIDWPYIQHPTPHPRTPMTRDFIERGLIVDEDVSHYDGTTAVVRSEHVSAEEIEYLRWKADRWMKLKHLPAALRHSPWFVLKNAPKMMRHTFAGSSLRSIFGPRKRPCGVRSLPRHPAGAAGAQRRLTPPDPETSTPGSSSQSGTMCASALAVPRLENPEAPWAPGANPDSRHRRQHLRGARVRHGARLADRTHLVAPRG